MAPSIRSCHIGLGVKISSLEYFLFIIHVLSLGYLVTSETNGVIPEPIHLEDGNTHTHAL